jgi:peptide/nickel transport system permease protein
MWLDGVWADLFLLAGGVVSGVVLGVLGGVWCAARPRTRASRAVEAVAMVFYCSPAYVIGFMTLLLFAPPFGLVQLPWFFDPHSYAPPLQDPWDFLRSMLLPWLVVGAPLAAAILRLVLALSLDAMGEDYVRTARAKGLPHSRVVRRHAAPPTYVSVASLFGASAPLMVTNMVLVEYVYSVPGFFRHMKRALGQAPGWPPSIDIPTLQALALWASVLIVTLSLLADLAIVRLDPRIGDRGRTLG